MILRLLLALPFAGLLAFQLAGPSPGENSARLGLVLGALVLGGGAVALLDRLTGERELFAWTRFDPFAGKRLYGAMGVYALSRLPFVTSGSFGLDPDAWRIARAGAFIRHNLEYQRSRPPGNPVVELAMSPVATLGPLSTNLLTAVVGAAGVWAFDRILRKLEVPHPLVGTLIFAALPLAVEMSGSSMDYAWALSAIMGGLLAALHGRWPLAGALLGLAAGCRVAAAPFAPLVFAWGLWQRPEERKQVALGVLACAAAVGLSFGPVVHRYGAGFLTHAEPPWDLESVHKQLWEVLGGWPAVAALVWLVDLVRRPASDGGTDRGPVPLTALALGGVACAVLPFASLPIDGAYLWPVVPFLLILGLRHASGWAASLGLLAVLVSGWTDLGLTEGTREGHLRFVSGRLERGAEVTKVLKDAALEPDTVFVLGPQYDALQIYWAHLTTPIGREWGVQARQVEDANVIFATVPEKETIEAAVASGRPVLVLNETAYRVIKRKQKVDLKALGVPLYAETAKVRR